MPADSAETDIELGRIGVRLGEPGQLRKPAAGGPRARPVTDHDHDWVGHGILEQCSSLNLNIRVAEWGQRAAVHGGRMVSRDS